MNDNIKLLKERIDCRELVKGLGIQFKGQNISCLNPSHPDNNPSMAVYQDHALCFGCNTNLDAFGIVEKIKGLSFTESLDYLSLKYNFQMNRLSADAHAYWNINNPNLKRNNVVVPIKNKNREKESDNSLKKNIWEIIKDLKPTNQAIEWLNKRKISVETAWELGCRDIFPAFKEISQLIECTDHQTLDSNSFLNDSGSLWSPLFNMLSGNKSYHGLIIPIFDLDGEVQSFRWRLYSPIKTNTATYKVFGQPSISPIPIGLNFAKNIQNKNAIYICEGEPDWLSVCSLLDENSAAIGLCSISSNNWKEEWTQILLEFKQINICLHDTEKARKFGDFLQNEIVLKSKDKKVIFNKLYEHYFDEKNDINDQLVNNDLKLEDIDFKLKEYIDLFKPKFDLVPTDIMSVMINPPSKLDFIFPGLLRGMVAGVVSAGGTGKSMWALQVCAAIACGFDSLNYGQINEGKSVFLSAEDPSVVTDIRIHKLGEHLSQEQKLKFHDNCRIYPLLGMNPNIFDKDWFDTVKYLSRGTKLVIIDTLRVFHNEDENDGGKMSELIKLLGIIAKEENTSVIFLHHVNKNSSNAGSGDQQGASRGSSVLTDNIKLQINLVTMSTAEAEIFDIPEEERKLYVKHVFAKMNYGAPIPDRWLKREPGGVLKPIVLEKPEVIKKSGGKKNGGI